MNRFYIERSLPYPLPSLATLLFASYALRWYAPFAGASLSLRAPSTQYTIFGYRSVPTTPCYVGTALSGSYLAFSASPTLPVAAGLAPAVLAEIASFVPIPPNIDIVVRLLLLLLLLLVMSKNKIKKLFLRFFGRFLK